MAGSKKSQSAAVAKSTGATKKKVEAASRPPPPSPATSAKSGKKRRRRRKKPKLSAEERRRRELAKWTSVRPQLLAERIAQSKIEMPYFLQVEYALMADKALADREQREKDSLNHAIENKQQKDRQHLIEVTERHLDRYEQRFQRALDNWLSVEEKLENLEKKHEQKLTEINRKLYLRKQELCKLFKEQELQDKLKFKEEARVGRILSRKYSTQSAK